MARKKLDREPLETMLWNYLERGRHPLEIFADRDYYLSGADETWNEAAKRIKYMPNYELVGICKNIQDDLTHKRSFNTYYEVFNYRLATE